LFFGAYLPWIIGFSSFSVLLYYAIGHVSAFVSSSKQPIWRRAVQLLGFVLCLVLLVSVPGPAVWASTGILAAAVTIRWLVRRSSDR
jgi:APA family basic amino acid/polyamine antiporter